ncbi:Tn3 family transposase [Alteromonas oceanisediminis]|uniref:Tn3 family transposase n=1 Tax=Alteromonas oceanisediminis TaxID=2836180 RepID=UPI001BDA2B47|nr:Tn3 family transposase [Alteromonas oceanisediminis]MBT0587039.1 Tn3 family transposase [Alteromonas oceanisediminis]
MARMKILSKARQRAFESIPKLTKEARDGYFTLDADTRKICNRMQSDHIKIGFLVQKAYFQAKGRFFEAKQFAQIDIKRAAKAIGSAVIFTPESYTAETSFRHRKQILALFDWHPCKNDNIDHLRQYANSLVAVRMHKEDLLFSLVAYCWMRRVVIPSYSQLADIIAAEFRVFDEKITEKVNELLPPKKKSALTSFFSYHSTHFTVKQLKRFNQGVSQRDLSQNADILQLYSEQFFDLSKLYSGLRLTTEAVKHFSDTLYLANQDEIRRLKNDNKRAVYFAAFIFDQYYKRQDFAADAIIKVVRSFSNSARGNERKRLDEKRAKVLESNKAVVDAAKDAKRVLKLIQSLTNDKTLSLHERDERIRQLVTAFFKAEDPEFDDHIERISTSILRERAHIDFYSAMFNNGIKLQRLLGKLVQSMSFDADSKNQALVEAINYFKNSPTHIDEATPTAFLKSADLQQLETEDEFQPLTKFRVLLFMAIADALKNKNLTLVHSYRYRQTPSYMISQEEWAANKPQLLLASSLDRFVVAPTILSGIGNEVTEKFISVNRRIAQDENPYFKLNENGEWRIRYPEPEFSVEKYIPTLLGSAKSVTLQDVMFEVERHTNVSACFNNRLPIGGKSDIDTKLLFAVILSLGTNIGHTELARASKLVSAKVLRDVENKWVSLANLRSANAQLVKTLQSLPLPCVFNNERGVLHSSSDGKKVVVNVNSLLANYSYKYYGKEQGISVNSFVDEKQSFFHVNVLTSSDREAPSVFEGMVSSAHTLTHEDIYEHKHSTDTHGYTEAVFAGLHFLNISFAPRIKNVHEQTLYAYEAKSLRKQSDGAIAPKTQINKKLILENWDDILRLMASIKLKRCSASQMLKMLSSSERDSTLYKAFKEFGRLLKTYFILNYIDDEELRQNIQKQLNRVELGQSLADEIMFGRKGKLQVGLKDEIELVMASNTLIRNMIILWNYLFLTDYYLTLDSQEERKHVIELIGTGSVIAWAHINFKGVYEFNPSSVSAFKSSLKEMMSVSI